MLFATVGQLPKLALMAASGAAAGIFYLLMRFVRGRIGAGFWLGLACDLILGMATAAILCAGLVIADSGRVRAYHLIGAGIGFLTAVRGLSPVIRAIMKKICSKMCRMCEKRWFVVLFR